MSSLISALISPLKVNKRPKDDDSDSDKTDTDHEDSKEQTPVVVAKKEKKEVKAKPVMHPTGIGYFTAHGRKLWITAHPEEYKKNKESVNTLQHDPDQTKPLYFWQLHSLLGTRRIHAIIGFFYKAIFSETDPDRKWFKDAFTEIGSLQHHVRTQSQFWLDAFGAGRQYHGGEFRLNFHHKNNAAAVMTAQGAELWMEYMRDTLDSDKVDLTDDVRVRPAINEFLRLMMGKYGHDFKFETDQIEY